MAALKIKKMLTIDLGEDEENKSCENEATINEDDEQVSTVINSAKNGLIEELDENLEDDQEEQRSEQGEGTDELDRALASSLNMSKEVFA